MDSYLSLYNEAMKEDWTDVAGLDTLECKAAFWQAVQEDFVTERPTLIANDKVSRVSIFV